MMARLIDADALKESMIGACNIFEKHGIDTMIARAVISIIDAIVGVDAEPVRHGRWVYVGEIHKDNSCCAQWDCSECGSPQTFFGCNPFYRYCPICGAKMEGVGEG